mmetsp:Transcript_25857/g.41595  ORF Transcript_25857/g.41595 Transcript_25857/m.41595 type:complete len:86 (-) Transcript_25857:1156-1413(-)
MKEFPASDAGEADGMKGGDSQGEFPTYEFRTIDFAGVEMYELEGDSVGRGRRGGICMGADAVGRPWVACKVSSSCSSLSSFSSSP